MRIELSNEAARDRTPREGYGLLSRMPLAEEGQGLPVKLKLARAASEGLSATSSEITFFGRLKLLDRFSPWTQTEAAAGGRAREYLCK